MRRGSIIRGLLPTPQQRMQGCHAPSVPYNILPYHNDVPGTSYYSVPYHTAPDRTTKLRHGSGHASTCIRLDSTNSCLLPALQLRTQARKRCHQYQTHRTIMCTRYNVSYSTTIPSHTVVMPYSTAKIVWSELRARVAVSSRYYTNPCGLT